VEAVFTNVLEPYPKEISQLENQLVLLKDSHIVLSPYPTESQKSTFKLASSTVASYTKRSNVSIKGSTLTCGTFKDIPPFEVTKSFHPRNAAQ
jgi:oligosaccharyltransferase complex subunit alpha (ribophorin I)